MSKRPPERARAAAERPALLEAQGIVKSYDNGRERLEVLRGLDLRVRRGELVLVIGPSGSGKSTLLHILGLLDRPDAGRVLFGGDDLYRLSGRRQAWYRNHVFGFVFQFFHLMPDFTAIENVLMPALIAGDRRRRQRALDLLERMGLADRADHRPSQLSGGERQRVAIARALVNDPEVLFMDEPTGNLDSQTAEQIHELIWDLNGSAKQTIVMVTHNEEIARRGGRIIRLRDGRILSRR